MDDIYTFRIEGWEFDKDGDMYEPGDENAPFFSEAFLYNLLGKEAARTVLAHIRTLEEQVRQLKMQRDS